MSVRIGILRDNQLRLVKGEYSRRVKLEWLFFENYEGYAAFLKASGCCAKVLKHLILSGFFMRIAAA